MDFSWLEPVQSTAFTVWGVGVTWSEIIGDITGLACVWLVSRRHIANWPIGLANNLFFFLTFWAARLYADAILQIVFAVLGVYGWWMWLRRVDAGKPLPIRHTTNQEWIVLAACTVVGQIAVTAWLTHNTDSPVPFFDAAILVLSLVATYGLAQKLLESWWIWIAVDVISVPLYVSRKLYPTAVLYFIFLLVCIKGLRNWRSDMRRSSSAPVGP